MLQKLHKIDPSGKTRGVRQPQFTTQTPFVSVPFKHSQIPLTGIELKVHELHQRQTCSPLASSLTETQPVMVVHNPLTSQPQMQAHPWFSSISCILDGHRVHYELVHSWQLGKIDEHNLSQVLSIVVAQPSAQTRQKLPLKHYTQLSIAFAQSQHIKIPLTKEPLKHERQAVPLSHREQLSISTEHIQQLLPSPLSPKVDQHPKRIDALSQYEQLSIKAEHCTQAEVLRPPLRPKLLLTQAVQKVTLTHQRQPSMQDKQEPQALLSAVSPQVVLQSSHSVPFWHCTQFAKQSAHQSPGVKYVAPSHFSKHIMFQEYTKLLEGVFSRSEKGFVFKLNRTLQVVVLLDVIYITQKPIKQFPSNPPREE